MRQWIYILLGIGAAALLSSCHKLDIGGLFFATSDNVEQRFSHSMEWNDANGYSTVKVDGENYKLYVFTDSHLYNDDSNLEKFVGAYCADGSAAPFVLCLGDLTDGGGRFNRFIEICSPIQSGKDTIFFALGNHDVYFKQWSEYKKHFHTASYCFDVVTPSGEKDLYICVDSGNGTVGKEQRKWLEAVLEANYRSYRKLFVLTHTHFFMTDHSQGTTGNFTTQETYDLTALFERYGVDLVFTGHDHHRDDTTFKGVRYIIVDALEDGYYATFDIGEKITVDYVKV